MDGGAKACILAAKVLPAALYGCPAAPMAKGPVRALRTAIAAVVAPGAAKLRALDACLAMADVCVDPV
eukprot:11679044-Alexandrium_andersonii.AAC.1